VSRLQAEILIIPAALEVIFSTTLAIAKFGDGRKHLLLAAEGWMFFSLALLDALSHIVPAARDSIEVFRIIDMVIAGTSLITILLYTVYLWFLVRDSLLTSLPQRFQKIPKYMLLLFIPAIAALHGIASFIGISYRQLPRGDLVAGFNHDSQASMWMFFTSFTLALLIAYQATVFCLTFYRLIMALINQRHIESTSRDSSHLIRGTGWIAGGLKLGAFETVVGFVQLGFGLTLSRRILRLLSRAFLIIGIIKGVDSEEDFDMFRKGGPFASGERRRSRLMEFISNPRHSTFRRLSPTDTTFQIAQVPEHLQPPVMQQPLPAQSPYAHPTIPVQPRPGERVTVNLGKDQAPVLEMSRFSALGLLSPSQIVGNIGARSERSQGPPSPHDGSLQTNSSYFAPGESPAQRATSASSPPSSVYLGHQSLVSNQSLRPESLRELAFQFPSLPTRATDMRRSSIMARYREQIGPGEEGTYSPRGLSRVPTTSSSSSSDTSSSSRTVRKPTPPLFTPPSPVVNNRMEAYNDDDSGSRTTFGRRSSLAYVDSQPKASLESIIYSRANASRREKAVARNPVATQNPFETEMDRSESPSTLQSGESRDVQWSRSQESASQVIVSKTEGTSRQNTMIQGSAPYSPAMTDASWMDKDYMDEAKLEAVLKVNIVRGGRISRIETVGNAPRRNTPTPLHIGSSDRKSMAVDGIVMPSHQYPGLGIPAIDMGVQRKLQYGRKAS